MFSRAITRIPPQSMSQGLTTAALGAPDFETALAQHKDYCAALTEAGLSVQILDALPEYPDSVFVEDPAVMLPGDGAAVLALPGAPSRTGEAAAMRPELEQYGDVFPIEAPGTLDGGDVLLMGKTFFVGITSRTNRAGFEQFKDVVDRFGYRAVPVPLAAGLHLKTDINAVAEDTVLASAALAARPEFRDYRVITVPGDEAYAANCLLVNETLLVPEGFPRTLKLVSNMGAKIRIVDTSEFRKMDGGLTCLSLRF
ncbi:dimethylarginine dimethylaminohydrolase family protein [Salidesulfovibrio onnuriiensis]|uniref:dimethylarginine dimethylaminohydrolase family protein n=1 Tax=Salidesulfovibrio onnuriiensis TaxID=2583823 RepID=UPI001C9C0038|nr:arginine deiminase-related protein [Salidesulfovibrio onnuriiensis]